MESNNYNDRRVERSMPRSKGLPSSRDSHVSRPSRTHKNFNNNSVGSENAVNRGGFSHSRSYGHNSAPAAGTQSAYAARSSYAPRTSGGSSQGYQGARSGGYGGYRGGGASSFRGGSSRGGSRSFGSRPRGRNNNQNTIDPSRFINKAGPIEDVVKYVPTHKFNDFILEDVLKANIAERGYILPTPIQDQSIPHILEGKDIVGIANTGTGKTGAFLIPILNKILRNERERALIIAPTRELAQQIQDELQMLLGRLKIFSVCCVGGASISRQINQLRHVHNFVIGTPGRIKDLIDQRYINLSQFRTLVLDEADRMLDMGFIADIRLVVSLMPKEKQTLFFSATLSPEIESLIHAFLRDPARVSVKTRDTSKNVDQDIVKYPSQTEKFDVLSKLLAQPDFSKVLIFLRTKHGAERLSKQLTHAGFLSRSIHGDKSQRERERALELFKKLHVNILVATDVAARGLDISGITHVINYDVPATYEDYVHRIGRTGRGDASGKALTFVEAR